MFNQQAKTKNSIRASALGVVNQLLKILFEFIYRTVFLLILSKEYLGLNGLFVNILTILSLADLGIGTAIVFQLYQPIRDENVDRVAALMGFYRKIFHIIALVVLGIGLVLMPFLKYFIKDLSEIPADVNLYVIYSLFLLQSVTSYLFVYKQSLLSADQRNDIVSVFSIVLQVCKYAMQILILFLTRNYTLVLAVGIVVQLAVNYGVSLWVTKRYREVFRLKGPLEPEIKKRILHDTKAMLCHRIGGTVVSSTDNILLSMFIGVGVLGIYSNYALITSSILTLISQVFATFTSSIGQLCLDGDEEHKRKIYFNILYANMWIAGFCAVCLFVLLNPFLTVWQGTEMILSQDIVLVLCVSSFITLNRQCNLAFVNASGLFNRDIWRPLVEASVNLVASILFVRLWGIIGIFLGTVLSSLSTVVWREPYLIFRHQLHRGLRRYWIMYAVEVVLTVGAAACCYLLCALFPDSLGYFLLKLGLCLVIPNAIFLAATGWTSEFRYYLGVLWGYLHHFRKRRLKP